MLNITQDTINLFWRTNKAMTLFFFACFLFLAIGVAGMLFDPRQVLNAPTWAKDVKFSISLILYTSTMLWMYSYIQIRPRLKSFLLSTSAAILFLEMSLIVLQGARAVPMHFNVSTPFDAALWSVMGVFIMIFYVISIIGFILFLRQPVQDRTLAWSMKLGMAIMLVGFGVAFLMTNPQPDQIAQMQNGIAPTLIGAHTVGAPDGGPGLPLLGWSTAYGDLRVAHFIGIHGPQALALFGFALILFSRRRSNRLTETHRLFMVVGAFLAYLGLVLIVTWQALREQPLIAPDALTLAALAALVLAFVGYNAVIIAHAYRTPQTKYSTIPARAH
jgi:hypothetical protein